MEWGLALAGKDIIYILALVLSGGIAWGSMIRNNGYTQKRIEKIERDLNGRFVRVETFQDLRADLLRIEKKIDVQQERCMFHFSYFPKG